MKIRIKFSKSGSMKFIGHLDIMRYFQKVMRRADIDIMYSEGFSPHQKMSFAAPLGVGLTSKGEYFDIEVNSTDTSDKMLERLNNTMVDEMSVLSYRLLPEDSKNAMSIVSAADYLVNFREGHGPDTDTDITELFENFMSQDVIEVVKTTKKSEKTVDIKPLIYEFKLESDGLFLKLAAGSENNLKPELVMQAFYEYIGLALGEFDIMSERLEIYGKSEEVSETLNPLEDLIPLEDFGNDIIAPLM